MIKKYNQKEQKIYKKNQKLPKSEKLKYKEKDPRQNKVMMRKINMI